MLLDFIIQMRNSYFSLIIIKFCYLNVYNVIVKKNLKFKLVESFQILKL